VKRLLCVVCCVLWVNILVCVGQVVKKSSIGVCLDCVDKHCQLSVEINQFEVLDNCPHSAGSSV